jgi:hypothetical protein
MAERTAADIRARRRTALLSVVAAALLVAIKPVTGLLTGALGLNLLGLAVAVAVVLVDRPHGDIAALAVVSSWSSPRAGWPPSRRTFSSTAPMRTPNAASARRSDGSMTPKSGTWASGREPLTDGVHDGLGGRVGLSEPGGEADRDPRRGSLSAGHPRPGWSALAVALRRGTRRSLSLPSQTAITNCGQRATW